MSLYEYIKQKEGFRENQYTDAVGVPTIGYGRTTGDFGKTTRETEDKWLQSRVDNDREYVKKWGEARGYDWNPSQLDALTSGVFNMGRGYLDKVTKGGSRDNETIGNTIPLYHNAGGQPLAGLVTRRNEEAAMFQGSGGNSVPSNAQSRPVPAPTQPQQSFGDAFATARANHGGAGGTFDWQGQNYTTNFKEEDMNEYRNGTNMVPPMHYGWGTDFVSNLFAPKDLSNTQFGGTPNPSEYTTPVAPGQQIQGGFGVDPTANVPPPVYGETGDSSQDLYATMDDASLQTIAAQGNTRAQDELAYRRQEADLQQPFVPGNDINTALDNVGARNYDAVDINAVPPGYGAGPVGTTIDAVPPGYGAGPAGTAIGATPPGYAPPEIQDIKGAQAGLTVPPVVETKTGRGKFGDKKDTDLSLIAQTERRTSTQESMAARKLELANAKLQDGIATGNSNKINEASLEISAAEKEAALAAQERYRTDLKAESLGKAKNIASINTQNREIDARLGDLTAARDNVTDPNALAAIDAEIESLTGQKGDPDIEGYLDSDVNLELNNATTGDFLTEASVPPPNTNTGEFLEEAILPPGAEGGDNDDNELPDGSTATNEDANNAANNAPKEVTDQIGSQLESFFGLNGSDVQQAIGMYLLSRATGASHSGSMRWAGQQAFKKAGARRAKADAKTKLDESRQYAQDKLDESRAYTEGQADEAAYEGYVLSGKYTDESLLNYKASGDVKDLVKLPGSTSVRGNGVKTFTNKTTQESTLFYEEKVGDHTYWVNGKGQSLSDDWTARTPEQSSNDLRAWKNDFQGDIDATIAQLGLEPAELNTTSAALANDIASWAADKGYDVGDPEVLLHLSTIGDRALRQKLKDKGKKDVNIGTYMDYEALKKLSGPTEANVWVLNPSADPDKQKFAHGSFVKDIEAQAQVVGQRQNKTSTAVMATIIAKWNQTSDEKRKALGKPSKDQNRFVLFAMQELNNLTGG